MSWTSPMTFIANTMLTAAQMNTFVSANMAVVRAGGMAIGGQGNNHFVFASSSTQFATLAPATNKLPYFNGSVWVMKSLGLEPLFANGNSSTALTSTDVDTYALASQLTAKDTLEIIGTMESVGQSTVLPRLLNVTDGVYLNTALQPTGTNNIAAGETYLFECKIRQLQGVATAVMATVNTWKAGNIGAGSAGQDAKSSTVTTSWLGNWSVAFRHGGVNAGGTFKWTWAGYRRIGI